MCWQVEENIITVVPLTMCDSFPAARHDAVTQLDDLGDADYLLGVVALVWKEHQEEKDVGDDGLRISVWQQSFFIVYRTTLEYLSSKVKITSGTHACRSSTAERPERRMGHKDNSPELSHFNVLKLLQDKPYEHLEEKYPSEWTKFQQLKINSCIWIRV